MNWKEHFYAALLRFLQTELNHPEAMQVTSFEQVTTERWLSEVTSDGDATVIEIYYDDYGCAEWKGDFGELLDKLTEEGTTRSFSGLTC